MRGIVIFDFLAVNVSVHTLMVVFSTRLEQYGDSLISRGWD